MLKNKNKLDLASCLFAQDFVMLFVG